MNEVLNRLADEADRIIDNVNKAERRMDAAAPDYAVLQGVKLEVLSRRSKNSRRSENIEKPLH